MSKAYLNLGDTRTTVIGIDTASLDLAGDWDAGDIFDDIDRARDRHRHCQTDSQADRIQMENSIAYIESLTDSD